MFGTCYTTKLGYPKTAKKWDDYVLLWDWEYNFLSNTLSLDHLIWDGLNGKGKEVFDGGKIRTAPALKFDGFRAILKKDLV